MFFLEEKKLELPLHSFKLIMNEEYLSSIGLKSIRIGLAMHASSFNDAYYVRSEASAKHAKELLKLNDTLKICSIRLNIILYYS